MSFIKNKHSCLSTNFRRSLDCIAMARNVQDIGSYTGIIQEQRQIHLELARSAQHFFSYHELRISDSELAPQLRYFGHVATMSPSAGDMCKSRSRSLQTTTFDTYFTPNLAKVRCQLLCVRRRCRCLQIRPDLWCRKFRFVADKFPFADQRGGCPILSLRIAAAHES